MPKLENKVNSNSNTTQQNSSVLLEFSEDEVQVIVHNFEGEHLEMSRDQLQEFVNNELSVQNPANPNFYSQLKALLNLGRTESLASDEWVSTSLVLKDASLDDPNANLILNDKNSDVTVRIFNGFSQVRLDESYCPVKADTNNDEWMDVTPSNCK